ncbi:hypothetical protein AAEH88_07065, partial [Shewanella algae]
MVHTPVVVELNTGVSPELAVAARVGVVPKLCAPGLLKLMVWFALGVTVLEGLEAGPVPAMLLALTIKL